MSADPNNLSSIEVFRDLLQNSMIRSFLLQHPTLRLSSESSEHVISPSVSTSERVRHHPPSILGVFPELMNGLSDNSNSGDVRQPRPQISSNSLSNILERLSRSHRDINDDNNDDGEELEDPNDGMISPTSWAYLDNNEEPRIGLVNPFTILIEQERERQHRELEQLRLIEQESERQDRELAQSGAGVFFHRPISINRPVFNPVSAVDDVKYSIDNEKYKDYKDLQEKGLECPICLSIINGTVAVTTCLHKFCSKCIYSHYTKCRVDGSEPKCPMCRHDMSMDDIILESSLTEYLDSTIVCCKNGGCKEECKRSEYNAHILNCKYDKKVCKYCKSLFYDCDIKDHEEKCSMKTTKCNLCCCHILVAEYESHLRDKCPHSVVKCENNNCNYRTQRYKMSKHTNNTCYNRVVACPDGCGLNFEIHHLPEHKKVCDKCIDN